jgi:hypothetical protein
MATGAAWLKRKSSYKENTTKTREGKTSFKENKAKACLTLTGLLMEGLDHGTKRRTAQSGHTHEVLAFRERGSDPYVVFVEPP